MKKQLAIEFICFLFIILFGYAGGTKLLEYQKFTIQIGQSPLLTNYAGVIAWLVPLVEILIVGLLMIPRLRLIALYASFTMMVIFTAYIIAILNFSYHIPCSCGGVLAALGWQEHLIFNIAFVLLACIGIILLKSRSSSSQVVQA